MVNHISRRRFIYVGAAAAAGGALASRAPLAAHAAHTADSVTVNFWAQNSPGRTCNAFGAIQQQFLRAHRNIQMPNVKCGTGTQDFTTVLLAAIAAGNPPDAAIYFDTPVSLAAVGAVEPIDSYMAHSAASQKANWPASALASCQYQGKTWGLPATAGSFALWYNTDWFARKGISIKRTDFPKTWDDLRKLSKEFTSWKGGQLMSAGFVPMYDPTNTNYTATIYVWAALNGGQFYDAAHKKYTIDAEPNVAMMEYMLAWLNDEYKGDAAAVLRSANWTDGVDSKGRPPAFQTQKLAMVEDGFWNAGDLYNYPPKFKHYNVAQYPIGPLGHKTVSGYWPNWLIIPKGAAHPAQAFTWLDYLASTGMKVWFNTTPDLPANKTVPLMVPAVAVQTEGMAFARDLTTFFHHQLDISIPMWNSPVQGFATTQILDAVNKIMYKVAKPKDALASAQQASQAQLQKVLKGA